MKKTIVFYSILVFVFTAFSFMSQPDEQQKQSITICMDGTCGPSLNPWFDCKLYNCSDSSYTNLECSCGGLLAWCCKVDASGLTVGGQYFWIVSHEGQTCYGKCFTYSGGQDTVHFSCTNCITGSNKIGPKKNK